MTTTEDGVVLQGYVESLRWLALVLLELDTPMTICEPTELRDEFQHMQQQIEQILSEPTTCTTGRSPLSPTDPHLPNPTGMGKKPMK
ncbi:MAG: hypothetical protein ACFE0J_05070 [Elainellaceae cyanobacterium]